MLLFASMSLGQTHRIMIVTAALEGFNFATYCQMPLQYRYVILQPHLQCMRGPVATFR